MTMNRIARPSVDSKWLTLIKCPWTGKARVTPHTACSDDADAGLWIELSKRGHNAGTLKLLEHYMPSNTACHFHSQVCSLQVNMLIGYDGRSPATEACNHFNCDSAGTHHRLAFSKRARLGRSG